MVNKSDKFDFTNSKYLMDMFYIFTAHQDLYCHKKDVLNLWWYTFLIYYYITDNFSQN